MLMSMHAGCIYVLHPGSQVRACMCRHTRRRHNTHRDNTHRDNTHRDNTQRRHTHTQFRVCMLMSMHAGCICVLHPGSQVRACMCRCRWPPATHPVVASWTVSLKLGFQALAQRCPDSALWAFPGSAGSEPGRPWQRDCPRSSRRLRPDEPCCPRPEKQL
jgi:hypothetical protein